MGSVDSRQARAYGQPGPAVRQSDGHGDGIEGVVAASVDLDLGQTDPAGWQRVRSDPEQAIGEAAGTGPEPQVERLTLDEQPLVDRGQQGELGRVVHAHGVAALESLVTEQV